jgi:hypothetical protein
MTILSRFAEPRMLVGRVIHHQVDEDADATLLGGVGEFHEVAERAVGRINPVVV